LKTDSAGLERPKSKKRLYLTKRAGGGVEAFPFLLRAAKGNGPEGTSLGDNGDKGGRRRCCEICQGGFVGGGEMEPVKTGGNFSPDVVLDIR